MPSRRRPHIILVLLADIALAGIGLIIFALFHHVLPRETQITGESLPRPTTVLTTTDEETTGPLASNTMMTETSQFQGQWGEKFAGRFSTGNILVDNDSYQSANIAITIEKHQMDEVTYYIADIYLRDIEYFRTAFAGGSYARNQTSDVLDMAVENSAVLAITGDYYGIRDQGVVIRNGELYRSSTFEDVLVLYYDGRMETMTEDEFDLEKIKVSGAWQAWSFGPMLLDHGQVMKAFNSNVTPRNPRSAIGYYEPGHYCFVLVDGRQAGYSIGLTLGQMSGLFFDLGCQAAYNLDGGESAVMTLMDSVVNQPYRDGRPVSDIVFIGE